MLTIYLPTVPKPDAPKMVCIRMGKEGHETLRRLTALLDRSQRWVMEDALRRMWSELADPCAPREDKSPEAGKAARPTR